MTDPMPITRRHLLAGGGALAVTFVLHPVHPLAAGAAPTSPAGGGDPVRAVLAAYVSTLVPGPDDDPDGTPGAVEAGAVEQLEAQVPYVIPLIVTDVTAAALATHGQALRAVLDYPDREALLVEAPSPIPSGRPTTSSPWRSGPAPSTATSATGSAATHLGFPGPSDGYLATYTDRTGHGQPQADAVPA